MMGPNHPPGDSLRYWVQTLYTNEAHCLEMPPTYLDSRIKKGLTDGKKPRRDSSQDDHAETMPSYTNGPGIFQTLTVPPGLYYLSLYFFNRRRVGGGNAVKSGNNDRDYRLSVRLHPEGAPLSDISSFTSQPEMAHGRVAQYSAGVWKRFLVRGPTALTIQVDRNNSYNTELNGIMLDLVDEKPAPYFGTAAQWRAREEQRDRERHTLLSGGLPASTQRLLQGETEREASDLLFDALQEVRLMNAVWWATSGRRFYEQLLLWYQTHDGQAGTLTGQRLAANLGACAYWVGLYPQWEACQERQGLQTARQVEKSLRWDGSSEAGQGYQVVKNYLAPQHSRQSERQAGLP